MKRIRYYLTWALLALMLVGPFSAAASQHDYEITTADANTGVTFRAAVNAALQALASLSSGASAPTITYAYQLWADTGNDLLKIRNTANSAWITIGKLSGVYLGLASVSAQNEFTATQKIKGDALLLRIKDTGTSGEEWAIRSDGGNLEIVKNTGTEGTPTWTVQARIDVNALRIGNGTASDIRVIANNNAATKPEIRYQNSSSKWQYSNDGALFTDIGSGGNAVKVPVRQTCLSAAVDANGYANFISAGTGLAANIAATSTPIRIAFAAGFDENGAVDYVGTVDSNTSISSLAANSTNFLYAERNSGTGVITLGKTLYPPAYDIARPSNTLGVNSSGASHCMIGYDATYDLAAESFTVVDHSIVTKVSWRLKKVGSPTGNVYVEIQTDNAGVPSGTVVTNGTSNTVAESSLSANPTYAVQDFTFATNPILTPGVKYHAVLKYSGRSASTTNYSSASFTASANGYTGGNAMYRTSGGTWNTLTDANTDLDCLIYMSPVFFFSIPEMKMYDYSTGSGVAKQIVFLGEAITGGSSVTSAVNYALRGEYAGDWAVLPGTNVAVSKNHNIGTTNVLTDTDLKCLVAEYSYSVGDIVKGSVGNASAIFPLTFQLSKTAMSIYIANTLYITALRRDTGIGVALTPASWNYRFKARRGF